MKKKLIFMIIGLLTTQLCLAEPVEKELEACTKAVSAGNFAEAAQHAAVAVSMSDSSRRAYLCQARAYTGLNDHAHALESLLVADKLSKTPLEHIVTIILIGNKNIALHDFNKAIDQFSKGLLISQEIGDKHFEMVSLNQIGQALEGNHDYSSALDSYLKAQKLAANDNERADSNARLASAYGAMNNYDKAIEYQLKAMLMEERAGDFDHYTNACLELGRIYIEAKQFTNAEKVLTKSLEKVHKAEDPYWEAKGDYYLALTKEAQGDSKSYKELLGEAKTISEKIGASDLLDLIAAHGASYQVP